MRHLTASQKIAHLEHRLAQLERRATHWTDVYHPSEMVDGYVDDMGYEKYPPSYSQGSVCDSIAEEMSRRLKRKGYKIQHLPDWVGYMIHLPLNGITYEMLDSDTDPSLPLCKELVLKVMNDAGFKGNVYYRNGVHYFRKELAGGRCLLSITCSQDEGLSFDVDRVRTRSRR